MSKLDTLNLPTPDYRSEDGTVYLYRGDCLDILPEIPDGSIDAVVTDPPYAIPTQVASGRTVTRNVGDLSIIESAFRQYAVEWKRAVGESGRIFIFCDGASYPVIYRAAYCRFNLASMVWDKGKIGMGREFRKRHELIVHGWGAETPVVDSFGVGYADIIETKPVPPASRSHPAEKPVDLLLSMLRVCGRIVADPFCGSASAGIACVRTCREFIGCEISTEYFDIAVKRIEQAFADQALFAGVET